MQTITNSIDLISKHIDESNLSIPILEVNSICSFTGKKINRGVDNKVLIKKTFTDYSYVRYNSGFSSVEAALCIESVIPSKNGFNSLRNYSYFADSNNFEILSRQDVLDKILSIDCFPFVICVTYSNKKHTSYKSVLNFNSEIFTITTDLGNVVFNVNDAKKILPIISSWYSVIPSKKDTLSKPTFFTKSDILKGCANDNKIKQYGICRYFSENKQIEKYRNTSFFKLLVHILNKTQ